MTRHRFAWHGAGRHAGPRRRNRRAQSSGGAGWFSHMRLYRAPDDRRVNGVCGGLAAYFGLPSLLVRAGWLIALFVNPMLTLIGYFLLTWLLPLRPDDLFADAREEAFWQQVRKEPVGTVHDLRHTFRTNEQRLRAMEAYVTSPEFELNRELRGL